MKFKIILFYDESRDEIGRITEDVAKSYCARHGYELAAHRKLWRPDLPPMYSCGSAMAAEMDQNPHIDWFFRLDSDSIIVNQDITLESIVAGHSCSLLASSDHNGLCNGVFMMKNSGWSSKLLDCLAFLGEMSADHWKFYDQRNTFDQSTLKCLVRHFPRVSNHVALLPETLIQNPRSAYSPGAFMMHYWSASGLPMIADKMREAVANGWSRKAFYQWGEKVE